ncbi:MAG: hypothetical protein ACK5NG_01425 [Chthoniobacterales bacterium]
MKDSFTQRVVDKFSSSRDFTISFVIHTIIIMLYGTAVLFDAPANPQIFSLPDGSL